ncbi:enoyl-CoA hydratase-related protein [Pseudonocardia yuanmonensis]|uniref:Enoyl-CoA hydratase-related protein n=1 Tax=Pseudonocardia yuanmonensis TaxID=1095914 RepID=A0ABP8X855_9PSEU|nr:enoyl-CoA hydratase-related protein [Pseudonocardia terrae]MCE3551215.1 enoyl-CoA hydratase-related protein [Pseudonocardia terrae]
MSIGFTKDGHVARVTLDNPKALNAISPAMDDELLAAWTEIDADPDIWVAVLDATPGKAFCAGADVSGGTDRDGRMALGGGLTGVGGPRYVLRKPLIAAVHGYVIGGGFELAMCADVIVAADDAQFFIPEVKAGIIGESGILHRAVRRLPHHVAMGMILTGDRLPVTKAEQYGLVNEVVPVDELAATADRWAAKIMACAPLAVQAAKDAALRGLDMSLEQALGTRYEPIEAYAGTKDQLEGLAAFAEKRKPVWTGR